MTATAVRRVLALGIRAVSGVQLEMPDGGTRDDLPQQAVFYANHSSHLDFVTLWSVLPERLRSRVRPIAAKDYWSTGIRHRFAVGVFRAYLVDRGGNGSGRAKTSSGVSPRSTGGQIDDMVAILQAGDSLIIFPEGTRGDGEQVARFHAGLYKLAEAMPDVPVIPVRLHNLGRMMPKGAAVPVPLLAQVSFGEPLPRVPGESRDDYLTRARAAILPAADDERSDQ